MTAGRDRLPDEPGCPIRRIESGCITITLSRPAEHNRIDPDDIPVLTGYLDEMAAMQDARALVLTGSGAKTFCSGYTIGAIQSKLDRAFEDMLGRIEGLPLPTICALNGGVYGGGTDLALCCDFRIGVNGMKMFMPAANFALHYYPGGLRRFVNCVGPAATKKIFLTGLTLESDELLRIGYLTEVVAPDQLDARVSEYLTAITRGYLGAQVSMKSHINGLVSAEWNEEDGRRAYEASLKSSELSRRLAALARRHRT